MKETANRYIIALLSVIMVCLLAVPASANYSYDGFDLKTMTNGTVQGGVYSSYGSNGGLANDPYSTTYSNVPAGTVKWARLYVGIWGGTQAKTGWVNTTLNAGGTLHYLGNVTLNGINDNNPTHSSGTNAYSSGNGVWMVSYNCTDNVTSGSNTATATTGGTIDGRVYGIALVVVYENSSLPKVQYWVNEGNVNLNYVTPLNNTISWFNGTAYNSTEANLTAMQYTGTNGEHDYLYLSAPYASDSPYNLSNIGWNIDGYRRYQLDSNDVANASEGAYFDFDSFTSANSSTALKNVINTTGNNYAIFWRGHDDDDDHVINTSWNASGVEGEAYVHPIMTVLVLDNITRVYDFSDDTPGTPGEDAWAYRYQVDGSPTASDPSTEFTTTQYTNISVDDDLEVCDVTTTDGDHAAHRFNFSIDETNPEKINVTWIGKGWHDAGAGYHGAKLYIWNFTSAAYEQLNSTTLGTEVPLTGGVVVTTPSDYVNSGNVTILVKQTSPEDRGVLSHICTDYVRLVVTPDP